MPAKEYADYLYRTGNISGYQTRRWEEDTWYQGHPGLWKRICHQDHADQIRRPDPDRHLTDLHQRINARSGGERPDRHPGLYWGTLRSNWWQTVANDNRRISRETWKLHSSMYGVFNPYTFELKDPCPRA